MLVITGMKSNTIKYKIPDNIIIKFLNKKV